MKKNTFLLFTFLLFFPFGLLIAGEGMWIPMLLERLNEKEMREMGIKLQPKTSIRSTKRV